MTFSDPNLAFYTVLFLVPGYITSVVLEAVVVRGKIEAAIMTIRILIFSGFNLAANAWLLRLWASGGQEWSVTRVLAAWVWIIFVSPAVIGVILAHGAQRKWPTAILMAMGLKARDPIPTGWDAFFRKLEQYEGLWAFVTLKDNANIVGWFNKESLASSVSGERDVYISNPFQVTEQGFFPMEGNLGYWVPVSEIRMIHWMEEKKGGKDNAEGK